MEEPAAPMEGVAKGLVACARDVGLTPQARLSKGKKQKVVGSRFHALWALGSGDGSKATVLDQPATGLSDTDRTGQKAATLPSTIVELKV